VDWLSRLTGGLMAVCVRGQNPAVMQIYQSTWKSGTRQFDQSAPRPKCDADRSRMPPP
jgi:hypothetical protein